jgi:ATP-dependent Lhr-like helicase
LERRTGLLPSHLELGLVELAGRGAITCDSFGDLRRLITPPSRRRGAGRQAALVPAGRWALLHEPDAAGDDPGRPSAGAPDTAATLASFCVHRLLARYGVIFRHLLLRERLPVPWRDLLQVCRHLELRGEVRGGRFVAGFSGEQYALPDAVTLLRRLRRRHPPEPLQVGAADPLNLQGILTPQDRVSGAARRRITVAG